jgi:ComF family protein
MNFTNIFFNGLLHLLYPQTCAGCGSDIIADNQLLCSRCIADLPVTNFHLAAANPVEKLFTGRLQLYSATSFLYFTKQSAVQRLLHQLKYKGNRQVGMYLGKMMGAAIGGHTRFNSVDLLLPLPLHRRRQRRRGYNQAAVICEGLAESLHVPVVEQALQRKVHTATQTKKNRTDRWENMRDRFQITNMNVLENKHVLLVDDVVTTGATLEACGSTLLRIPGITLSIATLAYAVL